jgi:hypothetical protein
MTQKVNPELKHKKPIVFPRGKFHEKSESDVKTTLKCIFEEFLIFVNFQVFAPQKVRLLVGSHATGKKLIPRSEKTGAKMIQGPRGVLEGKSIFLFPLAKGEQFCMQKCAKKRAR